MKAMRSRITATTAFTVLSLIALGSYVDAQSTIVGVAVDTRGNVGIGTATPLKKLDVSGDTIIRGSLFGNGGGGQLGQAATFAGYDNVYGTRNFALGFDSTGATPQQQIQIYAMSPTVPGQSIYKTFVIPHPTDPSRYLVHATLEGPEAAVYYRGSARLTNGRAVVRLPHYFEALTKPAGRTVQLTNVDGFDRLAVKTTKGARISGGSFTVVSDNRRSDQAFDWQVMAVRRGETLEVEPLKAQRVVAGIGPYTYSYRLR